tara:strand:+ start:4133 stop:5428 length:1296 start_codon:yes stop_codon:yes gene_type:complete
MNMKPMMESWRRYLHEGQKGTAFETVVVAVARGEDPGKLGREKMGSHGGPWAGTTFTDMARECLLQMGLQPKKVRLEDGSVTDVYDADAMTYSSKGTGISGDPKTDIIVAGKQISLKMPGAIQLSSGEGASSEEAMKLALDEFLRRQTQIEKEAKWIVAKQLKDSVNNFFEILGETYGKRYLPSDPKKEGYLTKIAIKAKKDYNKKDKKGNVVGTWPSSSWEGKGSLMKQGTIREVFATEQEWVKYFLQKAMHNAWKNDRNSDKSYDVFQAGVGKELKEKIKSLSVQNEEFFNILVDEWLTGRRQFATSPEAVAHYLLSPDGFYPIQTEAQTSRLSSDWKDFIKTDVRAKGREFLSKSITVRIGFDANNYYKGLGKAALEQVTKTAEDNPLPEGVSTSSDVDEIAQQMMDDLLGDVTLEVDPFAEKEVEFS